MKQYKFLYLNNGGRFQTFINDINIDKALIEFRKKSTFSTVELIEISFVKYIYDKDKQKSILLQLENILKKMVDNLKIKL